MQLFTSGVPVHVHLLWSNHTAGPLPLCSSGGVSGRPQGWSASSPEAVDLLQEVPDALWAVNTPDVLRVQKNKQRARCNLCQPGDGAEICLCMRDRQVQLSVFFLFVSEPSG